MSTKKDIITKLQNIPPVSGMFYLRDEVHRLFPTGKVDQPPSTITWLMEAVITFLRGLDPHKLVIS
jgi:hypothetical protein